MKRRRRGRRRAPTGERGAEPTEREHRQGDERLRPFAASITHYKAGIENALAFGLSNARVEAVVPGCA
ncbi:MAG: hypothetical protein ACRDIF_07015 [Actinomycetota bacterium]